jgi:hypothetical protein
MEGEVVGIGIRKGNGSQGEWSKRGKIIINLE